MIDTRSSLAVVDDDYFYTVGKRYAHGQISTLADLVKACGAAGITHPWVLSGSRLSAFCSDVKDKPLYTLEGNGKIAYTSVVPDGGDLQDAIKIAFPQWGAWPWLGKDNVKTLLATVAMTEKTLGIPLEWSSGHMALDYVKYRNAARWSWLAPLTIDLTQATPDGFRYGWTYSEKPWHCDAGYLEGKYLVGLDRNSAYGAGMTGLNVGEGNPTWTDKAALAYDGKRPGFWHVAKIDMGKSIFDGLRLPGYEGYHWLTTDMIEQLRRVGYGIVLDRGWFWEIYHQTLRSVVSAKDEKGLWDLRLKWRELEAKSDAHGNVYETISAILHAVHGKIGDDDLSQKKFYRPDILAEVIARSNAMMVYYILKFFNQFALKPVKITVDELWYCVDDPAPLVALADASKLGGVKHTGTVALTPGIRANWDKITATELKRIARAA